MNRVACRAQYILLALLCLSTVAAHATDKSNGWVWTEKEQKSLKSLEKKIKTVKGYQPSPNVKAIFTNETFYVYERDDYAVFTNTTKAFAAELALYTEQFVAAFKEVFPIKPRGKVLNKLVIAIFKDREEYKMATNRPEDEWSRGLFSPNETVSGWPIYQVFSYVDNEKQASISHFPLYLIQHEGTHAMIKTYAGSSLQVYVNKRWINFLPAFVNEGCATFFEDWDLRKTEEENYADYDNLFNQGHVIQAYLKIDPEIDFNLEKLLLIETEKTGSTPWAPDDGGPETTLQYALAQSYVHYLLSNKKNQKLFKKMFKNIFSSKDPFEEKELEKVSAAWHAYLHEKLLPPQKKDKTKKK